MLLIRDAQMHVLHALARRQFEERMGAHLASVFPEEAGQLGPDGLRTLVGEGVEKARGYGLSREREVGLFLNLLVGLGARFDEDEAFEWAQRILRRGDLPGPTKMHRLYRRLERQEGRRAAR